MHLAQESFIDANHSFLTIIQLHLNSSMDDYGGHFLSALLHHDDPHPKRLLRQIAFMEILDAGIGYQDYSCRSPKTNKRKPYAAKIKKYETSKVGKYVRFIVDLRVPASLSGFWLTKLLKDGMAKNPIHHNGGNLVFIPKPTTSILTRVFLDLINPEGSFHFVYHSDDSCFAIRVDGVVHIFNLDISGCDASHSNALFAALLSITPDAGKGSMRRLIRQARNNLKYTSPHNALYHVLIKFLDHRLYSGATITTLINNLACLLIGLALSQHVFVSDDIPGQIAMCAERVGYVVTCDSCDQIEDITFLGNFPCIDLYGEISAVYSLGSFCRSMGRTKGDLPGRGPIESRAKAHFQQYLNGTYPRTHAPFIDKMRNQLENTLPPLYQPFKTENDGVHRYFSDDAILKRYRLTQREKANVIELSTAGFEDFVCGPGISKLLMKDYGLGSVYRE
jgi:hypothetical protein